MPENERLINVFVNKLQRTISLFLVGRERQDYDESEFFTHCTKSGIAFIEFTHVGGASVITPSAWINIEMF